MKRLILPLLFCLPLISCARVTEYEDLFYAFGQAPIHIITYQGTQEDIQELRSILNKFSKETDNYLESDVPGVYTINHTSENVQVSNNLYNCLRQADSLSTSLESYFSIYLGSLSKVWKESLANNTIPSSDVINDEMNKMHLTSLTFNEDNKIQKTGLSEIDLGAYAKGYALDLSRNYFETKSISQYIVDAGSSSILLGQKNTDDGLFTIKIKDLENTYIKVKNTCVSTSSIREQSTTIDGQVYTHIINPETGEAQVVNDTVIVLSESGALGDALSTSMMLMSEPEIVSTENEFNIKSIVIRNHKVIHSHKDIIFEH